MILSCLRRRFFPTNFSSRSLRCVCRFSSDLPQWQEYMRNSDCRPIAIRDRVNFLIRLSDLDTAAKHARLAPLSIERRKACENMESEDAAVDWICSAIVVAMCKAERYRDAMDLVRYFFVEHKMKPAARCSFNSLMIKAILGDDSSDSQTRTNLLGVKRLAQEGEFDEAMDPFISRGFLPCTSLRRKGFDVSNSLIRGLLDLGDFEEAHKLFGEQNMRDGYYNLGTSAKFMEYWFEQGKEEEAMEFYRRTVETFLKEFSRESRVVPYSKIVNRDSTGTHLLFGVMLKYDKKTEAWELFHRLLDAKKVCFECDPDTLNLMVNECFKMGRFYAAIDTFKMVHSIGWITWTNFDRSMSSLTWINKEKVYKNIIARFCEVGLLDEAERFFAEMRSLPTRNPDVSTYTILMDAYVKAGRVEDVVRISNLMVDAFLGHVAQLSLVQPHN